MKGKGSGLGYARLPPGGRAMCNKLKSFLSLTWPVGTLMSRDSYAF